MWIVELSKGFNNKSQEISRDKSESHLDVPQDVIICPKEI